jgi:hypothetical protein
VTPSVQLLLANYKLDLSDRKTKRFFKQKERALLAPECDAAIGEVTAAAVGHC